MKKRRLGSCVTFFPQPATLVVSADAGGAVNLMMASWAGIVSKTPPTMAVSLHHGRKSYANIRELGWFSVNAVPAKYAIEADLCGLASGKDTDKFELTGLTVESGATPDVQLLSESPLNVECRYSSEVVLGDYRLVLGEIVEIHACDAAFVEQGSIDARQFDPLVYLGGLREYWSLGEKVADAYRAGLSLLPAKND
ncbi:MAG: NADPH-flavin oxidoreductase [Desulfuromonas sp.]|nr:MAG: NADPH-flavin oxidoreductase [Desulfuromonas sp.]